MRELIGKRICELRESMNITPSELAMQMGVALSTVYNWEQGRNLPATELLPSLATILNTTIDNILVYSSKNQIRQSMTKFLFNIDYDEYEKTLDLARLNDDIKSDAHMEYQLLSMEMIYIGEISYRMVSRYEEFLKKYGEENQDLSLLAISSQITAEFLYNGGPFILDRIKKENETSPTFITQFKLAYILMMTAHCSEALELCQKLKVEYKIPILDFMLAQCKRASGRMEEASKDFQMILDNRSNYGADTVISTHECLYRNLIQNKDYQGIIDLTKESINWLPEEYAKEGYDAEQAKQRLKDRLNRYLKLV